jgi:hypothetical protein
MTKNNKFDKAMDKVAEIDKIYQDTKHLQELDSSRANASDIKAVLNDIDKGYSHDVMKKNDPVKEAKKQVAEIANMNQEAQNSQGPRLQGNVKHENHSSITNANDIEKFLNDIDKDYSDYVETTKVFGLSESDIKYASKTIGIDKTLASQLLTNKDHIQSKTQFLYAALGEKVGALGWESAKKSAYKNAVMNCYIKRESRLIAGDKNKDDQSKRVGVLRLIEDVKAVRPMKENVNIDKLVGRLLRNEGVKIDAQQEQLPQKRTLTTKIQSMVKSIKNVLLRRSDATNGNISKAPTNKLQEKGRGNARGA